jgi:hypothetical protein
VERTLISVTFDWPKVATSVSLFGTVFGVQFSAVFQSPLVGFRFQVALPPRLIWELTKPRRSAMMHRGIDLRDRDKPWQGVLANRMRLYGQGGVGFID